MNTKQIDVAIIGGGVSGTALLYQLARHSPFRHVVLLEKYSSLASVNSHGRNNSQTLHCGDIETNYTLEKALQVQRTAQMVVDYVGELPPAERKKLLFKYPKMVLGVGDAQCERLARRYEQFAPHFPGMEMLEADGIATIEPKVVEGRHERILALAVRDQYSAVDFAQLARSFAAHARSLKPDYEIHLGAPVRAIHQEEQGFRIDTPTRQIHARAVVVSTGGHSLLFAQRMGYGLEYACLPVAGSFYYTPQVLNGKVYTVQNDKLPFAAVHGDPDILQPGLTRFGPTALVLPVLERHHWETLPQFLQVTKPELGVLKTMGKLFAEGEIRRYMGRNMLYEVPGLGRRLFLSEAQKIVPSLKLEDLTFAKGVGGIRPVMIDKQGAKLHLGEAQINPGTGILFNMTPSPGATSCLGNAERDARLIVEMIG